MAASFLFSFALACATPFPALAALAALHLKRRDAAALIGIGWFHESLTPLKLVSLALIVAGVLGLNAGVRDI